MTRKVAFVCAVLLVFSNSAALAEANTAACVPPSGCDSGWSEYGGSCYRLSDFLGSWQSHSDACAAEGAHIASIHSRTEQNFVVSHMPSSSSGSERWQHLWLGARTHAALTDPYCTDGTPFDFPDWDTDEPSRRTDHRRYWSNLGYPYPWYYEECGVIDLENVPSGRWHDTTCGQGCGQGSAAAKYDAREPCNRAVCKKQSA